MQDDFTTGLSRFIIWVYNFLGLISIPILTIIIGFSMANVFLHGQLAGNEIWQKVWAFVFAFAIEVNVVRLLFERRSKDDWNTLALAIGLGAVALVALMIESVQTSVGVDWNSGFMHWGVVVVLGLRVIMVMWLLVREGDRYGAVYRGEKGKFTTQQSLAKPQKQPKPSKISQPTMNGHSDSTAPTTVLDPQDSHSPF